MRSNDQKRKEKGPARNQGTACSGNQATIKQTPRNCHEALFYSEHNQRHDGRMTADAPASVGMHDSD